MPKLDEQISTLQQKLQQLKLRQQRIDARKRAISELRERKIDTRRKILMGGLILDKLRQGKLDAQLVNGWLDEALMRPTDRALFGLPDVAPGVQMAGSPDDPPPSESQLPPRLEGDDGHGIR